MTLGEAIRKARAASGYSQDDLAYLAKVATSTVSRIEAGQKEVSFSTIASLSRVLGISLDELSSISVGATHDTLISQHTVPS